MTGSVSGGWEYIWAAYLITWGALGLYAASLLWRRHKDRSAS